MCNVMQGEDLGEFMAVESWRRDGMRDSGLQVIRSVGNFVGWRLR